MNSFDALTGFVRAENRFKSESLTCDPSKMRRKKQNF
jgi:hypothetical protein